MCACVWAAQVRKREARCLGHGQLLVVLAAVCAVGVVVVGGAAERVATHTQPLAETHGELPRLHLREQIAECDLGVVLGGLASLLGHRLVRPLAEPHHATHHLLHDAHRGLLDAVLAHAAGSAATVASAAEGYARVLLVGAVVLILLGHAVAVLLVQLVVRHHGAVGVVALIVSRLSSLAKVSEHVVRHWFGLAVAAGATASVGAIAVAVASLLVLDLLGLVLVLIDVELLLQSGDELVHVESHDAALHGGVGLLLGAGARALAGTVSEGQTDGPDLVDQRTQRHSFVLFGLLADLLELGVFGGLALLDEPARGVLDNPLGAVLDALLALGRCSAERDGLILHAQAAVHILVAVHRRQLIDVLFRDEGHGTRQE
mmetsp:Transcript_20206/g.49035  ORF Transcript_20206/g.49035 Transcript_20206/m.49035 type:complete len:374 (-) Transcript_20206:1350-2471(-)